MCEFGTLPSIIGRFHSWLLELKLPKVKHDVLAGDTLSVPCDLELESESLQSSVELKSSLPLQKDSVAIRKTKK